MCTFWCSSGAWGRQEKIKISRREEFRVIGIRYYCLELLKYYVEVEVDSRGIDRFQRCTKGCICTRSAVGLSSEPKDWCKILQSFIFITYFQNIDRELRGILHGLSGNCYLWSSNGSPLWREQCANKDEIWLDFHSLHELLKARNKPKQWVMLVSKVFLHS